MANLEDRGNSIRLAWRFGGGREGAKQSCTFTGEPAEERHKVAQAAKALVESRGHQILRAEVYAALLGTEEPAHTSVPTFKQWAAEWIEMRRQARDVEPSTLLDYERCLKTRAIPFLGSRWLTEIDRDVIKAWVAWVSSNRVSRAHRHRQRTSDSLLAPATVEKQFTVVGLCLGGAVPRWLPANPASRQAGEKRNAVGLPKKTRFPAMFLASWETSAILDACSDHIRDLVFLALRSGLRVGELVTLQAQHVVFAQNGSTATVLVRRTLKQNRAVGSPKSSASSRDVTVSAECAVMLRRRVVGKRPSGLVFPAPAGGMWHLCRLRVDYFYRAVADASRCAAHLPERPARKPHGQVPYWRNDQVSVCDCAGVLRRRPRIHDLRHTHASALIDQGWHTKKIQARLGHSSYQVTMDTYGHLMDLGDDAELDGLEDFFDPTLSSRRPEGGSVRRLGRPAGGRRHLVRRAASGSVRASSPR